MLRGCSGYIPESTGKFPPTPIDQNAAKVQIAAKFGEPAAMRPKTAVIPIHKLKAHLQTNPQNMAPTSSPMFCDSDNMGACDGMNSFLTGVKMSDVTIGLIPPPCQHCADLRH